MCTCGSTNARKQTESRKGESWMEMGTGSTRQIGPRLAATNRRYNLEKVGPFISQLAHLNFPAHLVPIPGLHFFTTDPPPRVARHLRLYDSRRILSSCESTQSLCLTVAAADSEEGEGPVRPPAMDGVGVGEGGGQLQGVNPDCPNAANPFHRCAEYCPVPPPRVAAKSPPPPPGQGKAVMNGTAHRNVAERVITAAADSDEISERSADSEDVGERRRSARTPARDEEAGVGEQWRAVNPDCPNAANPFHRCAEYCPVPVPRSPAKMPPPSLGHTAMNGSAHSDGELHPRPRRRDKGGGSGGLPLYVFLREGSDGEGKKVDPRCPNAPNPFHVCTDHCLAKMAEAGRSSEGGKSPLSIFSRHSRRSSSSSEEGSVKSGGSRKVNAKCPNAANPFHECGDYCAAKMQQVEQQKGTNIKSPRKKGGKDVAVIQNWKVDPRCPNASNPFHICAQYCFDHLNEAAQTNATKSDKKKGKAISKDAQRGEINPDCANASNPYHQCGEYCKRKGDR